MEACNFVDKKAKVRAARMQAVHDEEVAQLKSGLEIEEAHGCSR